MCHDEDSRPPSPPTVGAVRDHGADTLTGDDGTVFAVYRAEPAVAATRNVVILPDVRGLHPYYEQLAIRFAEAGYGATALDWFGRTSGTGDRGDDFDWQANIAQVRPADVRADVAAAVADRQARSPGPVFTVGFCFGGSQSWRLAASDVGLAGCVGFYGQPRLVADVEPDIHLPLLMLVAGGDAYTPPEDFTGMDERLTAAGKTHRMQVYPGAPHSFFDRAFGDWHDACDDAWAQITAFTDRHS